jgi:hypothetical protein
MLAFGYRGRCVTVFGQTHTVYVPNWDRCRNPFPCAARILKRIADVFQVWYLERGANGDCGARDEWIAAQRCRGPRRPAPGLTTATECSSGVEHQQIRGGNSVERELWIWVNRQVPKWGYGHECSDQRR